MTLAFVLVVVVALVVVFALARHPERAKDPCICATTGAQAPHHLQSNL
jgi:hypothetical protein